MYLAYGQARAEYETRWQHFKSSAGSADSEHKLSYIDIPWPAEDFAGNDELISIVFAGTMVRGKRSCKVARSFASLLC